MASFYMASMLSAVGHLANFGQISEVGHSRTAHRENMIIAKAALQQDSLALRLDLLSALKEDIRDHYTNHTGQVDTLLIITTLLFTFGLATLQFSDPFVLKTGSECPDCLEVRNPWLCYVWIILVASVLIFPFWSLVMALWCKFQLDRWLGSVSKKLNVELRWAVRERAQLQARAAMEADEARREQAEGGGNAPLVREGSGDETIVRSRSFFGRIAGAGRPELRRHTDPGTFLPSGQGMLNDPAAFVDEYQDQFEELWADECAWLIETSTCIVWFSATFAALLTTLMFGTFLANRHDQQIGASALFSTLMTLGFLGPGAIMMRWRCRRRAERGLDTFANSRRASVSEQRRQPLLRCAPERSAEIESADTAQPEAIHRSVTEPPRRSAVRR